MGGATTAPAQTTQGSLESNGVGNPHPQLHTDLNGEPWAEPTSLCTPMHCLNLHLASTVPSGHMAHLGLAFLMKKIWDASHGPYAWNSGQGQRGHNQGYSVVAEGAWRETPAECVTWEVASAEVIGGMPQQPLGFQRNTVVVLVAGASWGTGKFLKV